MSENTVSLSKDFKFISDSLCKYHNITKVKQICNIELMKSDSVNSTKYNMNIRNFLFFPINKKFFFANMVISSRQVNKKMVNLNFSPYFEFHLYNNSIPIEFKYKNFWVEANRNQIFETCNYSNIVKSLFNYKVDQIEVSSVKSHELGTNFLISRAKLKLGRIHNYEDFIKLSLGGKVILNVPIPTDQFKLSVISELKLKKSFIFNKQSNDNDKSSHILSEYDCHSKILGIGILNDENTLLTGSNYIIQNNLSFRLEDLKIFDNWNFLKVFSPYFAIENIVRPINTNIGFNLTNLNYSLIYAFGISLKLNESFYLDFLLKTNSYNLNIDHSKIDKFRLGIEITTNL